MAENENVEETARLEPAVRSAIGLRGTTGAVNPKMKRPKGKGSPPATPGGFTLEDYTAGLNEEIENNFMIRDWEEKPIVEKLAKSYGPRYSRDDLVRAVALANRLNYCALLVESSCGDGDEAIAALEKEVPGFSRALYAEILGYMAYINR